MWQPCCCIRHATQPTKARPHPCGAPGRICALHARCSSKPLAGAGPLECRAATPCRWARLACCQQVAQARIILERMAAIQAAACVPALPLLMGDFNTAAHSAVYEFISTGAAALRPANALLQPWQLLVTQQPTAPKLQLHPTSMAHARPEHPVSACHGVGMPTADCPAARVLWTPCCAPAGRLDCTLHDRRELSGQVAGISQAQLGQQSQAGTQQAHCEQLQCCPETRAYAGPACCTPCLPAAVTCTHAELSLDLWVARGVLSAKLPAFAAVPGLTAAAAGLLAASPGPAPPLWTGAAPSCGRLLDAPGHLGARCRTRPCAAPVWAPQQRLAPTGVGPAAQSAWHCCRLAPCSRLLCSAGCQLAVQVGFAQLPAAPRVALALGLPPG